MSKYLITGAAGFIGFHLSRRLLESGHDVAGYDGLTSYYDPRLKRARLDLLTEFDGFTFEHGMIEDSEALRKFAELESPDIVIHLAAQAGVRYSIENPRAYLQSNVIGSQVVLEVAHAISAKHVMLASTSSVYGSNIELPFRELDRTQSPVSLYAATKIAMEALSHSFSHLNQIPTTVFRFFTVYGPWGRPDMALFKFVSAIERGEPIEIYGQGEMRRDFTYVSDLVDAIELLASRVPVVGQIVSENDTLSSSAPYRIVNIGGGAPVGLLDFVASIEDALGRKALRRLLPMQPGDVVATSASPALLEDLIGRRPLTPLDRGVRDFVDWYASYRSGAGVSEQGAL